MGSPFGQPAPGFGAAPMGMVAVTPYGDMEVDSEQRKALTWAIVSLFFNQLFAIGAFIQYSGSMQSARLGDRMSALQKAKSAQNWGMAGLAVWGVIIAFVCVASMIGAAAGG